MARENTALIRPFVEQVEARAEVADADRPALRAWVEETLLANWLLVLVSSEQADLVWDAEAGAPVFYDVTDGGESAEVLRVAEAVQV